VRSFTINIHDSRQLAAYNSNTVISVPSATSN